MTDIMIDVETLGTSPCALIVSIGAVLFDRHEEGALGSEFYERVRIDPDNGHIDGDTLEWWMARRAAWPSGEQVDLAVALRRFTYFIGTEQGRGTFAGQPLRLWSHGASFDIPILHSAYLTCGLIRPWGRYAPRDTRTLFDVAGVDFHADTPDGKHHALCDAKDQALAVQRALRLLRTGQKENPTP